MKILVTGATGFTGSYVIPLLLKQRHEVRCLVRATSDTAALSDERLELVTGDLDDTAALAAAFSGCDLLINIASLGFGHAPNIIAAAQEAGIKRALFVSTTAIFTNLNAPSKAGRMAAEQAIRDSGLDYTIVRPTMIYGSSRDRNMCRLVTHISQRRLLPIVGDGTWLQQPVYVGDLAWAIVTAAQCDKAIKGEYNISGGKELTYNDVIATVEKALGRELIKFKLPTGPIVRFLGFMERSPLPWRFPIKAEQILRLNEHKVFDFADAANDFGYAPRTFEEGIRIEIEEMGLLPTPAAA